VAEVEVTGALPAPRTHPSISAVLPAYNEEAVIDETVRRTAAALIEIGITDFEILVIDDGSSDATAARASAADGAGSRVRVVSHPRNRGYGAALRTGFDAATREAVFLMDSDGQFDPTEIARLLAMYGPDRVVCGYRIRRKDTWARRFYHTAFFGLVRLGFGPTARDVNCAFKLFPRAVGRGLHAEGALVSTELLVRARRSGYRLMDVGVHHYARTTGRATGADVRVVLRAFRELQQLRTDPALLDGLEPPA
jgi:glycosyltransferase involved in cell wall biosynthesis